MGKRVGAIVQGENSIRFDNSKKPQPVPQEWLPAQEYLKSFDVVLLSFTFGLQSQIKKFTFRITLPNSQIFNQERELLLQVVSGSETAFGCLYHQWEPRLSAFIFRITKSREITAEIVQDVFLKIWVSRESLEHVTNFKAYLYMASKNQAINALKKMQRELRYMNKVELQADVAFPSDENQEEEVYSYIDQAINRLSERQREIFVLSRYERLSYLQIAAKLGIGKESVKTHLKLATASIVAYLKTCIAGAIALISIFSEKV